MFSRDFFLVNYRVSFASLEIQAPGEWQTFDERAGAAQTTVELSGDLDVKEWAFGFPKTYSGLSNNQVLSLIFRKYLFLSQYFPMNLWEKKNIHQFNHFINQIVNFYGEIGIVFN